MANKVVEAESSEAARLCTTTIRRRNRQSGSGPPVCSAWEPFLFLGPSGSCFRNPELGAWDSASVVVWSQRRFGNFFATLEDFDLTYDKVLGGPKFLDRARKVIGSVGPSVLAVGLGVAWVAEAARVRVLIEIRYRLA
ncbi:hypothetical protein ACFX13_019070 [Malus domestica]